MIFSRGGGSGGRHAAEEPRRSGRHSADRRDDQAGDVDEGATPPVRSTTSRPSVDALSGPYDIQDAPAGLERVDLGSLQIPSVAGVEVRVQANADGVIQQVVLAHSDSALQLGVFAAPRSEDIWGEVRAEIRKSLFDDGVAVEEVDGEYGVELRARVRSPEGLMDLRFIGVDGPRWMVRAVYQGRAAADPEAAGPLAICLRGLVVNRGRDAMPVREALPLRLPREIADQARAQAAVQAAAGEPPAGQASQSNGVRAPHGTSSHGTSSNGPSLNGPSLYGPSLNGPSLNGASQHGMSSNGPSLNGPSLNGPSLNGPSLNGPSLNGASQHGTSSNGTSSNGTSPNGTLPSDTSPGGIGSAPAGGTRPSRRRPSPRPRRPE